MWSSTATFVVLLVGLNGLQAAESSATTGHGMTTSTATSSAATTTAPNTTMAPTTASETTTTPATAPNKTTTPAIATGVTKMTTTSTTLPDMTTASTATISNQCSLQRFTSPSGMITSPNYPSSYPASARCTWIIQVTQGSSVSLTFTDMDIEHHTHCDWDFVAVYDGNSKFYNRLAKLCGSRSIRVHSTSNLMMVKFVSDENVQKSGFRATYNSVLAKWSHWGVCNGVCGVNGTQERFRGCGYSRNDCSGSAKESRKCQTKRTCSSWNIWGRWSSCSVSCHYGTRIRRRTCNEDNVNYFGNCRGPSREEKSCYMGSCLGWTTWSSCSRTCGDPRRLGTQTRRRICNTTCNGPDLEKQICHPRIRRCPPRTSEKYHVDNFILASKSFFLYWKTQGTRVTFEIIVKTTGWIGLGISPSGKMVNSDIFVGWVANGRPFYYDYYSVEHGVRPRKDRLNWEVEAAWGYPEWTVFKISRERRASEIGYDLDIPYGYTTFCWAYGPEPDLPWSLAFKYHGSQNRGVFNIKIFE